MSRWLVFLLALATSGPAVVRGDDRDDIIDQKAELERLRRDVEQGQRRLDSLEREQEKVQKAIGRFDEKIASDRQVTRRLTRELEQVQADLKRGDSLLADRRVLLERWTRRYLGDIRQFYMLARDPAWWQPDRPNEELDYHRLRAYLTALAGFESAGVEQATALVDESSQELDDMSDRKQEISGLKREREASYALGASKRDKEQKNLDRLRRNSMVEADRVITLRKAAEDMAELLTRLEEQRAEADQGADRLPSAFAALRGKLLSPYRGSIVESYGEHTHPITHLKSFSPGVTIKGRPGAPVYTVASGTVAYSGNLRGYGNFVIINHDHQYYSTYANLGDVAVSQGQFVESRAKVGASGTDGVVKFELRKGRESLDPVSWIDIESL